MSSSTIGALAFTSTTNTYSPYLEIGRRGLPGPDQDVINDGNAYQEVLTNFPLGSQILTGLFLNITLGGPRTR